MIVRQSDAHAWAEALVGGQWRRLDPTAAVAPSRIQLGLGGSLPAGEPIPLLARLDDTLPQEPAAVVGCHQSRLAPQRDRLQFRPAARAVARMEAQRARAVADHGDRRGAGGGLDRRLLGWLAWRRRRQDRARALWDRVCARLARAGLAARRARRTARLCRARGGALAAVREGARHHRQFVCGAALRAGGRPRRHDARARVGALAPAPRRAHPARGLRRALRRRSAAQCGARAP